MKEVVVVGYGYWGEKVAEVLRGKGLGVKVVEVDGGRAADACCAGYEARCASYETKDRITRADGYWICVPAKEQYKVLKELVGFGVPVVVEKPFCMSLREAGEVVREFRGCGVPLMVDLTWLFDWRWRWVWGMVGRRKENGKVLLWRAVWTAMGRWRDDVSVLEDLLVHPLSLAIDAGLFWSIEGIQVSGDRWSALVRLECDASVGEILVSWVGKKRRVFEVVTENRVFGFCGEEVYAMNCGARFSGSRLEVTQGGRVKRMEKVREYDESALEAVADIFAMAVKEGRVGSEWRRTVDIALEVKKFVGLIKEAAGWE